MSLPTRHSRFGIRVRSTAKLDRCGTLILLLAACGSGTLLVGEEPADSGAVSKRISGEILAGFRRGPSEPLAVEAEIPAEVEPGVVKLPDFMVGEERVPARLDRSRIRVERDPPILGTGVTEIRGKKTTVKIMRIFYIPIGWKIEW